jgi:hypothetical protein
MGSLFMSEIKSADKIAIVEMRLNQVEATIYDLVIQKRVMDRVGDKEAGENIIKQLEKCERMKDEYNNIVKEIK